MYLQAERGLKLLPLRMKHHHNLGWRVMILLRRIYKHQVHSLSGCFFFFRVAPSVSCSDASARRRWPCLRCVRRPLMSTTYMYVFSASLHASCVSVFFFFFVIFFFLVCFSQQSRRVLFFWGEGGRWNPTWCFWQVPAPCILTFTPPHFSVVQRVPLNFISTSLYCVYIFVAAFLFFSPLFFSWVFV